MWNQSGICLRFLSAGPGLLSSVSKIKGAAAVGMKPLLLIREGGREELECYALCPQRCRRDGQLLKSPAVGFPHTWDLPCFTISDKCHLVRIIWHILTVIYYQQITAMLITTLSVQKLFVVFCWVFFCIPWKFLFPTSLLLSHFCYFKFCGTKRLTHRKPCCRKYWLCWGNNSQFILPLCALDFFLSLFFCGCVCLLVSCYGTHLAPWKIESCF